MDTTTPLRLLLVEDSEVDAELALRALRKEGFDITWQRVESAEDLRAALASFAPHAILSDFSMPRFDGAAALRIAAEAAPEVPFIFVSGTIGEERAIEAIRQGATDYVLKGNTRRLGTALRRALTEAAERQCARVVEADRARLLEVLEATSDYVGVADPDGTIRYLNAAGRRLIGVAEKGEVGRRADEIHSGLAEELLTREGRPAAERTGVWQGETALLGADGQEIPVSEVLIAHRAEDGSVRFFSTIARDIRERKAYEARIRHFANYDALTGLPNRNLLADRAAQAIAHCASKRRPAGAAGSQPRPLQIRE